MLSLRSKRLALNAIAVIAGTGVCTAGALNASPAVSSSPGVAGGSATSSSNSQTPRVFAPTQPRVAYTRYPWKKNIVTTVFWIGEKPTPNNPTPNNKSSWDGNWQNNYGGYDTPDSEQRDWDFTPKSFTPGLNPFYVALPYNDLINWSATKPEAKRLIPWFEKRYERPGKSVCKSQWIAIRKGSKVCYAQWEDCGPFETTDFAYVFGSARPRTRNNGGAGLDISPAVRDYLGFKSGERVDWRFVDIDEIPSGPWSRYGSNNHFVMQRDIQRNQQSVAQEDRMAKLREARDAWLKAQRLP